MHTFHLIYDFLKKKTIKANSKTDYDSILVQDAYNEFLCFS